MQDVAGRPRLGGAGAQVDRPDPAWQRRPGIASLTVALNVRIMRALFLRQILDKFTKG
jgi:hypothetical protein